MSPDELEQAVWDRLREVDLLEPGTVSLVENGCGIEITTSPAYEQPAGTVLPVRGMVAWRGEDPGYKEEWLRQAAEALDGLEGVNAEVRRWGDGVGLELPATGVTWDDLCRQD